MSADFYVRHYVGHRGRLGQEFFLGDQQISLATNRIDRLADARDSEWCRIFDYLVQNVKSFVLSLPVNFHIKPTSQAVFSVAYGLECRLPLSLPLSPLPLSVPSSLPSSCPHRCPLRALTFRFRLPGYGNLSKYFEYIYY